MALYWTPNDDLDPPSPTEARVARAVWIVVGIWIVALLLWP